MTYQTWGETLESWPLGDGLTTLLPKGYVECDAWKVGEREALESQSERIYAIHLSRFTSGNAVPDEEYAMEHWQEQR